MNTYQCFYDRKTREIQALNLFAAKLLAVLAFAAPKSKAHMVSVVLVQTADGRAIDCAPATLGA